MTGSIDSSKAVSVQPLRVGMTAQEAYYKDQKTYELFNFADKNSDRVIDEAEMRRFNGPLLVVEKDDKTKQRFIGYQYGFGGGPIYGNIITSKEFEFYPGMKSNEVDNSDFHDAFRDLDSGIKLDGELTKEEIEKYQNYVERKTKQKETIVKNEVTEINNRMKKFGLGLLGGIAGIIGGYQLTDIIEDKVAQYIQNAPKFKGSGWNYNQVDWNKVPKLLKNIAEGGSSHLLIGAGVVALGIGAGVLVGKLLAKKEQPVEDLKQLDKQYKNVYKG